MRINKKIPPIVPLIRKMNIFINEARLQTLLFILLQQN